VPGSSWSLAALTPGRTLLGAGFRDRPMAVASGRGCRGPLATGPDVRGDGLQFSFCWGSLCWGLDWRTSNARRPALVLAAVAAAGGIAEFRGLSLRAWGHSMPSRRSRQWAVHTGLSFLVLSFGILCARPGPGVLQLLNRCRDRRHAGAPAAAVGNRFSPLAMGWLRFARPAGPGSMARNSAWPSLPSSNGLRFPHS